MKDKTPTKIFNGIYIAGVVILVFTVNLWAFLLLFLNPSIFEKTSS